MSQIPLPPIPGPPDKRQFRSHHGEAQPASVIGVLIVSLLVFTLAVLLVSYPVRHSDLWYRLAAGRDLTSGDWNMSAYPAAIRETWLFNTLVYLLHQRGGGAVLVGMKALVVGLTGISIFQLVRLQGGLWLPALVVAACMVALGQRVPLQPVFLSCLSLVWVYRLLNREDQTEPSRFQEGLWIVLFFIWAQVDVRVVLGWVVVALAWTGELIDRRQVPTQDLPAAGRPRGRWVRRGALLAVLAVVCWLNPVVWQTASLREMWETFSGLGEGRDVLSPFQSSFFKGSGGYPAGWSYHVVFLLGLGLLLSGALRDDHAWRRWLPWFGLTALSAWDVSFIPWWAVWSGAVLGRQVVEEARRRMPDWSRRDFRPLQGVACCWMVGLIACAWPGWLQGPPFEPRRWTLDLPESAERTAALLAEWQASGRLHPQARGWHLHNETLAAVRWFCPKVAAIGDRRVAEQLTEANTSLEQIDETMRALQANYVVVSGTDRSRLLQILERLVTDPRRWVLLGVVGDGAIFGWRDLMSPEAPRWTGTTWNMDEEAFVRAAPVPPGSWDEARTWLQRWRRWFTVPASTRNTDRDSAVMYLLLAEAYRKQAPVRHLTAWETSELAALIGAGAGWSGNLGPLALAELTLRWQLVEPPLPEGDSGRVDPFVRQILGWQQAFTQQRDDTPSALLYLAIRSARRALASHPDDSRSYLILGESYLRLMHSTQERAWRQRFPELGDLRRAQASAALNKAVLLEPYLVQAHFHLGALYSEMGYLDLAVEHRRRYLSLIRRSPPPVGVDWAAYRATLDQAARELAQLEERVQAQRDEWLKEASGKRVGDRAELAARRGLADEALRTLLESDVSAFGTQGLRLELRLLLGMGRAREVVDAMEPDQQAVLGTSTYFWTRTQAWAALGDYDAAWEESRRLAHPGGGDETSFEAERAIICLLVTRAIAEGVPVGKSTPTALIAAQQQVDLLDRALAVLVRGRQRSDAYVLGALLALEGGQTRQARSAVGKALTWSVGTSSATSSSAVGDFRALPMARTIESWLQGDAPQDRTTFRSTR